MRQSRPTYRLLQSGSPFASSSFPQNRKPVIMKKTPTPACPSSVWKPEGGKVHSPRSM